MTRSAPDQPAKSGRLILVPNTLDLGCVDAADAPDLRDVLPLAAIQTASRLQYWVVENAKAARAFLKRVDAIAPLQQTLQQLHITELPRPVKGGQRERADQPATLAPLLQPAQAGADIGLLSEAGLPGVADPGAALVLAAHQAGLTVLPLAGASSLVLALAASGLNGQSFTFVGYLPQEAAARAQRLQELEQVSRRKHQTQLMIETPYRNMALLNAMLEHLSPTTWLSVSCGLTLAQGHTRTDTVAGWRAKPSALPADVPAVFSFLGC